MIRDHGNAAPGSLLRDGRRRYDHYQQISEDTVTTGLLLLCGLAIILSMGVVLLFGIAPGDDRVYAHRSIVSARLAPVRFP